MRFKDHANWATVRQIGYSEIAGRAAVVRLTIKPCKRRAEALNLGHERSKANLAIVLGKALDYQCNAIIYGHHAHHYLAAIADESR